jgi:hypothetical protein
MQLGVMVQCANPGRDEGFFLLENAHVGCGALSASYLLGERGLFVCGVRVKN